MLAARKKIKMKSIQEKIVEELCSKLGGSDVFTKEEIDQIKILGEGNDLSNQQKVEELLLIKTKKDENPQN